MDARDVVKRFGMSRALPLIGFCTLWRSLGSPPMESLSNEIRASLEEQGLSKSAAYRYIGNLKEWNVELGRSPEELDELAAQVAGVFDVPEEEKFPRSGKTARMKQAPA